MSTPTYEASIGTTGLAYAQPVGNQVILEQQTAANAKTRQMQQSVQLTDYTWIEQTTGEGVGAFTVMFDVAFTAEPVVAHGMTLPDFASEIRASVATASTAATDAQAAADSFTYSFPGNITVSMFKTAVKNSGTGTTPATFTTTGITNATNSGKRITLVVTHPGGTRDSAVLTDTGGTVPVVAPDHPQDTWQLLADGQPLAATSGPTTGTTHRVQTLTQEVVDARKKAAAAGDSVGSTLALGGDPAAYPLCNVFVKRWLMDNQSNYIGAECIVVVKTFKQAEEVVIPPPSSGSESTAS